MDGRKQYKTKLPRLHPQLEQVVQERQNKLMVRGWHFEKRHKAIVVFDGLIAFQPEILAFTPVALCWIERGDLSSGLVGATFGWF